MPKPAAAPESTLALSPSPAAGDLPFEDAIAELEAIVAAMEAGELPLEESLKRYQRGAELVQAAQARLRAAEQHVRVLEDGILKPLNLENGE